MLKRVLIRIALTLTLGVGALLLALYVAGALYSAPDAIPPDLAGKHVQVDGLTLRVLQEGKGRDILFIHGSPGVLEDFAPQLRALKNDYRVTAYDRPGHGFSSDGESYSFAYNAKVALSLIEKLGLERVIVVGHSYGGSTALALARLRSARVAAYVVLDSAAYRNVRPIDTRFKHLSRPTLGLGLARAVPRARIQKQISTNLTKEFLAGPPPPGFIALRSRVWSEPKVVHAMANEHWYSNAELAQQSAHYREIAAPLYIVTQNDQPARRASGQRLQREVKGAQLELVSNTGHYVQLEQAGAVTAVIRRAASEH